MALSPLLGWTGAGSGIEVSGHGIPAALHFDFREGSPRSKRLSVK